MPALSVIKVVKVYLGPGKGYSAAIYSFDYPLSANVLCFSKFVIDTFYVH